jgi:hypothetical protein
MPRTSSIRYFKSRKAYYTQYRGRQFCLAAAPRDEPEGPTYRLAVQRFSELISVSEVEERADNSPISGNGRGGVFITGNGSNNLVQGNFIGTNASGTRPLGNGSDSVTVTAAGNSILGNLISGNVLSGIYLAGGNNLVQDNSIGTDIFGTQPLGQRQRRRGEQRAQQHHHGQPHLRERQVRRRDLRHVEQPGAGELDRHRCLGHPAPGQWQRRRVDLLRLGLYSTRPKIRVRAT